MKALVTGRQGGKTTAAAGWVYQGGETASGGPARVLLVADVRRRNAILLDHPELRSDQVMTYEAWTHLRRGLPPTVEVAVDDAEELIARHLGVPASLVTMTGELAD